MLSTAYRIKLEAICDKIVKGETVELTEIIWAEKLSRANRSAGTILRYARRKSQNPNMVEGDMDDFLNKLDLGDPDPTRHKTGFGSVDEIVDWFKRDNDEEWRQRD
jgi:hypothetical protein